MSSRIVVTDASSRVRRIAVATSPESNIYATVNSHYLAVTGQPVAAVERQIPLRAKGNNTIEAVELFTSGIFRALAKAGWLRQ